MWQKKMKKMTRHNSLWIVNRNCAKFICQARRHFSRLDTRWAFIRRCRPLAMDTHTHTRQRIIYSNTDISSKCPLSPFLFQWRKKKICAAFVAYRQIYASNTHHTLTLSHRHIFHSTYIQRNLYVIGVWISNSNVLNATEKLRALSRIMGSKYIEIWLATTKD